MSAYAFIFARGNSKGLPGKNIKLLGGITLLGHSITIAQKIKSIEKIFVSTDSDMIAAVAKSYGVEVIERPDTLAGDTSAEWLAWRHAIEYLNGRGEYFDTFVSLPATSPLRSVDDVQRCIDAVTPDIDIVVTVTPASSNPYFNMLVRDDAGISQLVCASDAYRRQDAPVVYDMTAVAYVTRPQFILENERMFAGRVKSVVIPRERAIDIDDIFDFKMAEVFYENRSADER